SGHGINCSDSGGPPTVRVRDATIGPNGGVGIRSTGCTIELVSSSLLGNTAGGLSLQDSSFVVLNSLIAKNGDPSNVGGVVIQDPPPGGRFEHNTVALNGGPDGTVSGIQCLFVNNPLVLR